MQLSLMKHSGFLSRAGNGGGGPSPRRCAEVRPAVSGSHLGEASGAARVGHAGGFFCLFVWCLFLGVLAPGIARAQGTEPTDIVINEVLAVNNTIAPLADFPDYFPDYVELYNPTENDMD